jgi:hypothetical protein
VRAGLWRRMYDCAWTSLTVAFVGVQASWSTVREEMRGDKGRRVDNRATDLETPM